ncbi:response regulator transcription factor [Pelomonas sp. KK5]|uniref:response regulator transcription factor n=1 Tax=Pelomonas sp. KK5 TaxID=1855730 RepID=UPI00097BC191|nr:response regulator [Pelomonas sp. KK5]
MPSLSSSSGLSGRTPPSPPELRTVYVVDDEELIRTSLQGLLRSMQLDVRTFGSAEEFLLAPKVSGPACLVLDVRLRGESGLAFQQSLARRGLAHLPVIIMTGHGDVAMTVQAMKAGARDFLEKPFRQQEMIDAVIGALDADARRLAAERSLDELRSCWAELTPREREVLGHVAAGRMNKQIAGDMGIAEITAKIHRGQGMRKMRSRSVADLVLKMQALDVVRRVV